MSERLELIKESTLTGFDMFGEHCVTISKENYDWLINRVEELEEGVKEAVSDIENISPHEAKKTLMDLIKNMEGKT